MKTVKASWTFGNFAIAIEADVEEKHEATLVELGLLQILQRTPSSNAEKALAGSAWPTGKKSGRPLRPKGFERSSIPFTEANVATIRGGAFGKTAEIAEGVSVPIRVVSVKEHVGGEASPMVRATAFVDLMLGEEGLAANMRKTFGRLGLEDAEDADRDALIEFAHAKGMGADPKKV